MLQIVTVGVMGLDTPVLDSLVALFDHYGDDDGNEVSLRRREKVKLTVFR